VASWGGALLALALGAGAAAAPVPDALAVPKLAFMMRSSR
jgi:hypothetical protein